jgi:cation/acetate symporter
MSGSDWQLSLSCLPFFTVSAISRAGKRLQDEDFYAAGFSIGPVTNGLGMAATWASLATFLGVIALILRLQVPFVYLWIQWAISIPLLTLLYGTSLRRMKAFTPASFIRHRYGKPSTIVIVCWMILIMVMYALGQMVGLGQAFELLFGVPYNIASLWRAWPRWDSSPSAACTAPPTTRPFRWW